MLLSSWWLGGSSWHRLLMEVFSAHPPFLARCSLCPEAESMSRDTATCVTCLAFRRCPVNGLPFSWPQSGVILLAGVLKMRTQQKVAMRPTMLAASMLDFTTTLHHDFLKIGTRRGFLFPTNSASTLNTVTGSAPQSGSLPIGLQAKALGLPGSRGCVLHIPACVQASREHPQSQVPPKQGAKSLHIV